MAEAAGQNEYELQRDRRIAANKRKLQELGVLDAAAALASSAPEPVKKPRKAKAAAAEAEQNVERRVSAREKKAVNYSELESRTGSREPRAPVDHSERIKGITLDAETAEQLRQQAASKKSDSSSGGSKKSKSGGKARGPVDSGKGVRIQGGRVYDSKHGVTCHWCRQKTLEEHVTCTNPDCGRGRRMPLSFCHKCLANRHGEDCVAAEASGKWWCPCCRGSCGSGCVGCCNCGFCRKKMGLEPTHQVVGLARGAGFNNVHDYLVHLVTGEPAEEIAARKLNFPWGSWLKPGGADGDDSDAADGAAGAAGGGSSEASAQTGAAAAAAGGGSSSLLSDDLDDEGGKDQGPTSSTRSSKKKKAAAGRGKGKAAAATAAGSKKAQKGAAAAAAAEKSGAAKKGKQGATAAAAAAKTKEVQAQHKADQQQQKEAAAAAAVAAAGVEGVEEEDDCEDVPVLSSQDMTLPRKQRIMQALGLAPVTVTYVKKAQVAAGGNA